MSPSSDLRDPAQGSRTDWIADRVLHGLIKTMMRLPFETRVRNMGRVMSKAVGPLAGYLRRAEANLGLVYPTMSATERRRIAIAVCDNFGRTLIENFSHGEFGARLADVTPRGPGLDALYAARDAGRPVIFVTGHFGNHEAPRHVLTTRGFEIGGLYRPMANPYFNARYTPTMTSWGGPVFEQGRRGTMGFARHLAQGGMGTLLFDVNRDQGTPIPFLGHPAKTATSAADLALKFDALVLPYFGIRQPDGFSFDVVIDAEVPHTEPLTMMRHMTAALETQVSAHPEQWFWVHRRWKDKSTKA